MVGGGDGKVNDQEGVVMREASPLKIVYHSKGEVKRQGLRQQADIRGVMREIDKLAWGNSSLY